MITELSHKDFDKAAEVVAHAFFSDPMWKHIIPNDADRERVLPWLALTWVRYAARYGKAWTTENREGVALRKLPGKYESNFFEIIFTGMILTPWKIGNEAFKRLENVLAAQLERFESAKLDHHWYLWTIAVSPPFQGKGFGSSLMAHTFAVTDASRHPSFLETHTEQNVQIHSAHGFQIRTEGALPGTNLKSWTMERPLRR